jgi:ribosomal protein S27AE
VIALICPQCGSGELIAVGRDRLRCQHCGVTSEQNSARDLLSVLVWVCPKCGFDNEKQSDYCGKCGNSLTRECLRCGAAVRWDLNFCPSCRFEMEPGEYTVIQFDVYPFDRIIADDFERGRGVITDRRISTRFRGIFTVVRFEDVKSVYFDPSGYRYRLDTTGGEMLLVFSNSGISFAQFRKVFSAFRSIEPGNDIFQDFKVLQGKPAGCCLTKSLFLIPFTLILVIDAVQLLSLLS